MQCFYEKDIKKNARIFRAFRFIKQLSFVGYCFAGGVIVAGEFFSVG